MVLITATTVFNLIIDHIYVKGLRMLFHVLWRVFIMGMISMNSLSWVSVVGYIFFD